MIGRALLIIGLAIGIGIQFTLIGAAAAVPQTAAPKPAAKPVLKVTVAGKVGALVRGGKTSFVFLGQIHHFDVLLERVKPHVATPPLRVETDVHGAFKFPAVPVGDYLLRVRIPTIPLPLTVAELYRQPVTVQKGNPDLDLRMPFTVLKIAGPDGMPAEWDQIKVAIRRRGETLNQDWESGYQKRPGANPTGPLEEQGSIVVEMNGVPGNVSLGFNWQSHDKTSVLLPLVEENGSARYRLWLTSGADQGCVLRFSGARGQTPPELEARLSPYSTLVGAVERKDLPAGAGKPRLQVDVYDSDDHTDRLYTTFAETEADGSFSITQLPFGTAWVSATVTHQMPGGGITQYSTGAEAVVIGKQVKLSPLIITPTSDKEAAQKRAQFLKAPIIPPRLVPNANTGAPSGSGIPPGLYSR